MALLGGSQGNRGVHTLWTTCESRDALTDCAGRELLSLVNPPRKWYLDCLIRANVTDRSVSEKKRAVP
jgi:hypothetical protein